MFLWPATSAQNTSKQCYVEWCDPEISAGLLHVLFLLLSLCLLLHKTCEKDLYLFGVHSGKLFGGERFLIFFLKELYLRERIKTFSECENVLALWCNLKSRLP